MWWKRFKRRQRFAHKRNLTYLLFLFILLTMGIGYAVLNTTLGIDGTSGLANARWDIHFDNIQVKEGSVTPTTPATITDDTTVSFAVTLENPNDYYEFNVDVVNAGTINAMIDTLSIEPVLTQAQKNYLDYIVTYADGTELAVNQRLDAGTSENLRIAFNYKEGDPSNYPTEDEDITISVSIVYVQANGDAIDVPHPPTLYSVLEDAAAEGTYAREYTGEHQDSMAGVGSRKIYHWYAPSTAAGNTLAIAIQDKNNVLFARQCWQMIRTTDTGGVKMIYNGEAENNQCLNTRGTHVGYASRTSQNLASTYWYGTDYKYDSAAKTFKVSGTTEQTTWNATTGPGLIGKYTCKSTSVDGTCATLYLVESYYNTSSAYVIPLNSDSHYSQFGTLEFNVNTNSPSYVGYMYNTVYPYNSKTMTSGETMLSSSSLRTTYWYADNISYDSTTGNYSLVNPFQITATTDYPNLVGKYTFENATQTYTKTYVQYIAAVNNNTYYYIRLGKETGTTHDLSFYNNTYTYGESFTDNGNGTYTINSPTTVNRSDWYTSYSSVGTRKYVCKNAVNDTCSELWYISSTSNTDMTYIKVENNYKYAKSFSWDGSKYVLDNDTSTSFWNFNDNTNRTSLNNAHYTCWNETGECTTISYIYYISDPPPYLPYYINISNGKSVEDAKNEMLYNDNVNTTNSTIKSGVDAWYKHYLLEDYSDYYLEDTIFCNDRSQNNASTNGWNPNGGKLSTYMPFSGASDLSCPNDTDKFSVSNNKAQLTYKVGLMSYREMNLLNNTKARTTGQSYWLASPNYFNSKLAYERYVQSGGAMNINYVSVSYGVRPAVSLRPGMTYSTGDGSMANPYVVGGEIK